MKNPLRAQAVLPDGASALEGALRGESAEVLGRLGAELGAALTVLAAASDDATRRSREYAAAHIVWKYFVQREAMGLRRHDPVIEAFGIPRSVLSKVGASPAPVRADDVLR